MPLRCAADARGHGAGAVDAGRRRAGRGREGGVRGGRKGGGVLTTSGGCLAQYLLMWDSSWKRATRPADRSASVCATSAASCRRARELKQEERRRREVKVERTGEGERDGERARKRESE